MKMKNLARNMIVVVICGPLELPNVHGMKNAPRTIGTGDLVQIEDRSMSLCNIVAHHGSRWHPEGMKREGNSNGAPEPAPGVNGERLTVTR
jgi:hypothetical protein